MIAPGDQNLTSDLQSGVYAWANCLLLVHVCQRDIFNIIEVLGVSKVRRQSEQGSPLPFDGIPGQAQSPQIKNMPCSKVKG